MKKFEVITTKEINLIPWLGLQWEVSVKGKQKIHNQTHVNEAIAQLEKQLGTEKKDNDPLNKRH